MKFCSKCEKELSEEAVVCPGCGCEVKNDDVHTPQQVPKIANKKSKVKKAWLILSAVILAFGVIAAILFVPRDLKMKDIKKTNVVTAIIRYGLPESIRSDEDGVRLHYGDKVDFYGITPYSFAVYPETDEVTFFFNSDDASEVYRKIDRYCDLEENLLNMFHKFRYDDLRITTNDYDGSYVNIEIN